MNLLAGLFDAYPKASSTKMIAGLFDAYSLLELGTYKPSSVVQVGIPGSKVFSKLSCANPVGCVTSEYVTSYLTMSKTRLSKSLYIIWGYIPQIVGECCKESNYAISFP